MSSMHAARHSSARTTPRSLLRTLSPVLALAFAAVVAGPVSEAIASPPPITSPVPDPVPSGPGTGDPGQGRDTPAALLASKDLALVDTFRIGNASMAWGTSTSLPAADAAFRKAGKCGFRFVFRTRNQGIAGTPVTSNRIRRDTQAGPVLATRPLPALIAGGMATSDGHVFLAPGTWMLYVHADAPNLVSESDEANNLRRVRVTVTGSCAG